MECVGSYLRSGKGEIWIPIWVFIWASRPLRAAVATWVGERRELPPWHSGTRRPARPGRNAERGAGCKVQGSLERDAAPDPAPLGGRTSKSCSPLLSGAGAGWAQPLRIAWGRDRVRTASWSPACPVLLAGFVVNKAESERIGGRSETQRSAVRCQGKRALLCYPQPARQNGQGKEKFFMKTQWGVARSCEIQIVCKVCKE